MGKIKGLFPSLVAISFLAWAASGCGSEAKTPSPATQTAPPAPGDQAVSFGLMSAAFEPGSPIPPRYTCDGDDASPPLQWTDPPEGTQSFALIADDPDAPGGTWVHWVLFNLPAPTRSLPGAVAQEAELANGGRHGENSWKRLGYGGPCPPGGTHRYFFKLYALDATLDLDAGADKTLVLEAMEGHVLGQAEVMGTYSKQ